MGRHSVSAAQTASAGPRSGRAHGWLVAGFTIITAVAVVAAGGLALRWSQSGTPFSAADSTAPAVADTPRSPDPGLERRREQLDRPSRGGVARGEPPASRAGADRSAPDDTATGSGGTVLSTGSCEASNYWEPQPTASGEVFDPEAMTAAHRTWPFDTMVRVTNPDNGRSVVVRINDRGPYVDGRCLDLARGAFRKIASLDAGVVWVTYEVLSD